MRYLTEELYQKLQLFPLPFDEDVSLTDLAEWGLDLDELFIQELLARDEWYLKYTPAQLKALLFDQNGRIICQKLDDKILTLIRNFREQIDDECAEATAWVDSQRAQVALLANEGMQKYLSLDLTESNIVRVNGLDSREVTIELWQGVDASESIILIFKNVRESFMGNIHHYDANWWLFDEISVDDSGYYQLYALFGNADYIGQLQVRFQDIEVQQKKLID